MLAVLLGILVITIILFSVQHLHSTREITSLQKRIARLEGRVSKLIEQIEPTPKEKESKESEPQEEFPLRKPPVSTIYVPPPLPPKPVVPKAPEVPEPAFHFEEEPEPAAEEADFVSPKMHAGGAGKPPPGPPPVQPRPEPQPPEPKPTLEALIGGKWALRAGLLLIAIGTALFARLISPMIGPAAKVALAYGGAWALFAVGKIFEKRLKDFARPVMAGGLALTFFVSFTSHFVPQMRFLPLGATLAWMSAGVILILLFAERWKSQPTAGLAIFLGHASAFVAAGQADAFSLSVIVFLSATALLLLIRHDWIPLSLFALVAAYFSHLLWVLVERVETPPEQAFWINFSFLSSYYLIFLGADLIWWRRLKKRGQAAFTDIERIIGRISGPANLVLYASLVSFFYVTTKVYVENIHWFFFALAGVQLGVGWLHKMLDDGDYYFYPAVGVVFATMGFFSAFDALTLNLVLAAEAIILLITAHRTKIWLFHLLAQLALALNFGHYWFYSRGEVATLPYFIGGLATAAVYFLKSSLEEAWYGGEARIEWKGGQGGPLSQFFIDEFDRVFSKVAPYLAHVHAAAGAVIIVNQVVRYFSLFTAEWILSGLVLLAVLAALVRRSVPLLFGFLALEIGFIYFIGTHSFRTLPPAPWLRLGAAGSTILAANFLVVLTPKVMKLPQKITAGLEMVQPAIWAGIAMMIVCMPGSEEARFFYLPWICVIALIYVSLDRLREAFRRVDSEWRGIAFFSPITSFAASLLLIYTTWRWFENQVALPVWLVGWGAVLIAAAGLRKNNGFYLSGLMLVLFCYVFLLEKSLQVAVMKSTAASVWIILVTTGIALAQDLFGSTRATGLEGNKRNWRELLTYVIYALALLFLVRFSDYRISFPWSVVVIAMCSIILYAIAAGFKMHLGALMSFALLAGVHALAFYRFSGLKGFPQGMFVPATIFFAEAIAYERLLAFTKELKVSRSFIDAAIGYQESATGYADISFVAQAVVISAATAVIALAIYQSSFLGVKWTTAGWSFVGIVLVILGFTWKSSIYRRTALVLFALCLVRVFLVDTRNLSDLYKTIAFIILGICLLGMAWLYTRFSADIRKWL